MADKSNKKLIEEIGNMTVFELSELVKELEETFDVSAAPIAAAVPASVSAEGAAAEEKTEFKVSLQEAGDKKVAVIKAVKQMTGWGLGEAKKAVEDTPSVIVEGVAKEKAEEVRKALEEAGAKVAIS